MEEEMGCEHVDGHKDAMTSWLFILLLLLFVFSFRPFDKWVFPYFISGPYLAVNHVSNGSTVGPLYVYTL